MVLKELCGLWTGYTRDGGKEYWSGKLEDGRKVFVFVNDRKEQDNHPDYRLMVDDGTGPPPRDEQPRQNTGSPASRQRQAEQKLAEQKRGTAETRYENRREQMKSFTPVGDDADRDIPF